MSDMLHSIRFVYTYTVRYFELSLHSKHTCSLQAVFDNTYIHHTPDRLSKILGTTFPNKAACETFLNERWLVTRRNSSLFLFLSFEEESRYTFPQANNSVRIAERSIATSVNYRGSRYLTTGQWGGGAGRWTSVERRNRMNGAVAHHGGGV